MSSPAMQNRQLVLNIEEKSWKRNTKGEERERKKKADKRNNEKEGKTRKLNI